MERLLGFMSVVWSLTCTAAVAQPPVQQEMTMSKSIDTQLDYLLALPQDYESRDAWPLLLFLHGAGERGDDLDLVKVHGPPKLVENGQELPFIVVSPQCPKGEWWHLKTTELLALIDEVVEKYNVDEDRISITGLSMGGFGTWAMITRAPHRFAAAAPICGGGDRQFVKYFKHLPIWVFHGDMDRAVPFERSVEMVDALKRVGGDPRFTVYPGVGHDSWTESYNNPELYNWFLEQRRQPPGQVEGKN